MPAKSSAEAVGLFQKCLLGGCCCCSDITDFATTKNMDNIFLGPYCRAQFVLTSDDGEGTCSEKWLIMVQMKGEAVCFKQMGITKLMFETNLGWSSFPPWNLPIYSVEARPSAVCSLTGLMPAVAKAAILVAVWNVAQSPAQRSNLVWI